MSYLIVILIIGFIITIHELGHLIASKIAGIPVAVFSIGFGPKIIGMKINKTEYRVSLVPLGGYVLPEMQDENIFFSIPPSKRIIFSAGGIAANIMLSFMIYAAINLSLGLYGFSGAIMASAGRLTDVIFRTLAALAGVFTSPENLSGLVGLVKIGGDHLGTGVLSMAGFAALISINLAVFNLLPLPVLDGGKILMYLIEKITPKAKKLHLPLSAAGWIVILLMTIYATAHDIAKII
ncbi:MAG: site-2 protease family protein [Spirochaetes bacterium]|jgi:regulator of sigma E protease|nr:site-2 protease family protein [Spirochaetota bacterium]